MELCKLQSTHRSVEAAAMLHKEAGNFSKAADLIEQASTLYLEHGTQDTAAVVLDRAAKWVAFKTILFQFSLPEKTMFVTVL